MKVNLKRLQKLTQNLRVLYVEDNSSIQKKMALYLQKFFQVVDCANDGVFALEKFTKKKYDIVITDLSMPRMDGIQMIKKIKAIDEEQTILITTAHGESGYLMDAIQTHVDGYIMKPFDFDMLNMELYKIADKLSRYKQNEEYKLHLKEMLQEQTQEMQENYEMTIYSMVELIEQRDTYTAGHSKRVAFYCEMIAKHMGFCDEDITLLHQAAILHDVGKIETPDAVLLNPSKLNDIEYKLIQEHVNVGYKLLDAIPMLKVLSPIIKQHHERYDGKGYPDGLKGDAINKFSQIMIVADAFDAMTTNRIYKGRKNISEALKELEDMSEKQFHPEVIKSALVTLKDVSLDANINQLPKTKLEEERFAYFYKDFLTKTYNQNYLELVLLRHDSVYNNMTIFSLLQFTAFNKLHSWKEGDALLQKFAYILTQEIKGAIVFRVFGDDFILLSEGKLKLNKAKEMLDKVMQKFNLSYRVQQFNLKMHKFSSLSDIEALL